MMGWGGWWGRGVGRGFNRSFEQNRYRYIQFGYRYAFYETKSAEIAGNSLFWGVSPLNDIIISEIRHVLTPKRDCERTCCAIPRRKKGSHLENLNMWLTLNFQTEIFQ